MDDSQDQKRKHDIEFQFRRLQSQRLTLPDIRDELAQWIFQSQEDSNLGATFQDAQQIADNVVYAHHPEFAPKTFQSNYLQQNKKQKLRDLLLVSRRVKLEMIRDVLGMSPHEFNQNIFHWAKDLGCLIDGENLVSNQELDTGDSRDAVDAKVLQQLDDLYDAWERGKTKEKKQCNE